MRPYTNGLHATAPVEERFIVLFLLIAYAVCLAASAEQDHRAACCANVTSFGGSTFCEKDGMPIGLALRVREDLLLRAAEDIQKRLQQG